VNATDHDKIPLPFSINESAMKTIIQTPNAPSAIGTYSQAVTIHNTTYISGQIPLNPVTMTMITGDFSHHVTQTFDNLKAVITAANATLNDVVKLTIYLLDMNQFNIVNDIMSTYFAIPYPARAVVQVSRLPKDALIEIDAIVHRVDA
jgi:reactive intermediate/imine deaminase